MIKFTCGNGTSFDVGMLNSETGEDVTKILSVEYGIQITIDKDLVKAQCRLAMVGLDVTAAKTVFETLNPVTKKYEPVRAIEFCDGSRVEIADDGTPSVVPPKPNEPVAFVSELREGLKDIDKALQDESL
jgi:hypothetical protein